jgi:hypothetical protein
MQIGRTACIYTLLKKVDRDGLEIHVLSWSTPQPNQRARQKEDTSYLLPIKALYKAHFTSVFPIQWQVTCPYKAELP